MTDAPEGVAQPITGAPDATPTTQQPGSGGEDPHIVSDARPPVAPPPNERQSITPPLAPGPAPAERQAPSEAELRTAAADHALNAYARVDWGAWQAKEPAAAGAAWAAFQALRASLAPASTGQAPTGASVPPAAAQQPTTPTQPQPAHGPDPLESLRLKATRLALAERELSRDVEGWSPDLRRDLANFATSRGFSAAELAEIDDPRAVKVLHLAMRGEAALKAQAAARQAENARVEAATAAFEQPRPPIQLGGGQGAPNGPSDRMGTEAWMQARRSQISRKG